MIFKRIVQDLAECRELDFSSKYESLKRHDFDADIRYVILERFLSVENELNFQDEWLLDTYFLVKRFALSDQNAFGLDHTDTVVEHVPLLIGDPKRLPLRRMGASMTAPED